MAVEIALKHKYRMGSTGKRNASRGNNSGTNKHRGEDKNRLAFAQSQTRANQRMLVMLPTGRFRWVLAADWGGSR